VSLGRQAAGAVLALAATPAVWAETCAAPTLDASVGTERSRLTEVSSSGRQLVKESGTLRTFGIGASMPCAGWLWAGHFQLAAGSRDYAGQSQAGAPVQSSSDIRRNRVQLQALRPVTPALALGAQLDWTSLDRNIAGAGMVQGYPEQYRYMQAALGARYVLPDVAGMQLGAEAWLGGGPGGHVDVQLPATDAARMKLGASRWASLGLTLASAEASPDAPGWAWRLRLDWRKDVTRAGVAQALYSNGFLVGGAVQPKFSQTALGLDAALRYRF
jgi:hypothetical protein